MFTNLDGIVDVFGLQRFLGKYPISAKGTSNMDIQYIMNL